MPTTTIDDLDDLALPFEGRGTPTLLDSAITLPDSYNSNFSYTFTITGLESTDTVAFQESANLFFSDGYLSASYPDYSGTLGYMNSSGPGSFIFTVSAFVLRPFLERALEALVFSTTDERETSTRQLGYSLSSIFYPGNDITGTIDVTLDGPEAVAPVTLADLTETAVFNAGSFDQGAQLLDSDVTVTLEPGFDSMGSLLSVAGLVQGDTVNLRLQGAGSPFTITQHPSLPEGSWRLHMDGDEIANVTFGYNDGTAQSPFMVEFLTPVSAATIETVIENIQFSTATENSARTLSLTLTGHGETTPMVSQDIAVSMVPEIGGIADEIWIDGGNPNGPLGRMVDVPNGDYSGGKLTISGLIGNIDIPGIADGSMFYMDNPDQVQGNTYNVYWFSSHFATITIPGYHDAGDLVVDFLMSGTSSGLVESFMNELRFKNTGALWGIAPTRELTFTVETVQDGITAQSTATLTYGKPELTGVDFYTPYPVKAGGAAMVLDDDVTVTLPAGITLEDARIEVTGLAAGDVVGLSDAGPFRVDGAGNLILTSQGDDVTIGTFEGGYAGYDADSGQFNSTPAVIRLNEDAPSWVLEAIIENLTLASEGRFSTDNRTLNVSVYNAQGNRWINSGFNVSVTGNSIDGLKNIHYTEDSGIYTTAPFVDTSISLAPGNYTGWTLEVNANGDLGDTAFIGAHIVGNRHFVLLAQPDQSITLFYVNEFNHTTAVGSYSGIPHQNGIGGGFRIQVSQDSTWSAEMLEHLMESVTLNPGGPLGTQSSITYKLSNAQGVFYEDTVQVVKSGPVAALDGLASSITVNTAVLALDGPVLIDSDVTVPETFSSGLLNITVAGQEPGDVLGVRTFETPAVGQFGLSGNMVYRQGADGLELIGYVNGGEGRPLVFDFFVGVTAEQVEAVLEALTFTSTSNVINRELAITLTQDGAAVVRGFVDVNLDRTPLIEGLSRVVKFDAATIATTPMNIDTDVTLPTDVSYSYAEIVIQRPAGVQIGIGGDYSVQAVHPSYSEIFLGENMDELIAIWGFTSQGSYISFGSGATREIVESVMEALTFTSTITDGPQSLSISLAQSVSGGSNLLARTEITLQPAAGNQTLTGTEFADTLTGDEGHDLLSGLEGDDQLSGMAGRDTLLGGDGDDSLLGGGGFDRLSGEAGNDTLHGVYGDDRLLGGAGEDVLFGGRGNDRLWGSNGNDWLSGNKGNDMLDGGNGNDSLFGRQGADSLFGRAGTDSLRGGADDDQLFGGAGDDRLLGEDGADTLSGGAGSDTLNGGDGADVFVFGLEDVGTGVDLIWNFQQGVDALQLSVDLIDQLESMGFGATDAIHWNGASRTLSLDFEAVGLSGGQVAIARFSGVIPEDVTASDFIFG
jgi:hypothetical protein